jgi:alkanesulfonate monooxygenase SsuD/methylene tetrahydromethanopterin reductase-like flavin-dependent oxidoreductase (luciferase family)
MTGTVAVDRRPDIGPIGLILPTFPQARPLSAETVLSSARRAEAAGVGALWASDHLFWHGPNLECFTALAVAATATHRCALGTAVLQLPLRQPAAVAKAAGSLQMLSRGRFILGVGAGIHEGEFLAAGADYHHRGRILDDGIAAVRRAWARTEGDYPQLPSAPPVPIWVGGSSPAALRRAAASADGWIPMFLGPDKLAAAYAALDEELAVRGRSPQKVTRAVIAFVSVGSGHEARDRGLAWMSRLYRLPAGKFARHLVWGEPEACASQLRLLSDAGAEHVALFVADDDPVPHVEALGAVMEQVVA